MAKNIDPIAAYMKKAPYVLYVEDKEGEIFLYTAEQYPMEDGHAIEYPHGKDGDLYGKHAEVCLPYLQTIVASCCGKDGITLNLNKVVKKDMSFRGRLPLDETAGAKVSLLCELASKNISLNAMLLMALRISRMSRELAACWLAQVSRQSIHYTEDVLAWSKIGLRIALVGNGSLKDENIVFENLKKNGVKPATQPCPVYEGMPIWHCDTEGDYVEKGEVTDVNFDAEGNWFDFGVVFEDDKYYDTFDKSWFGVSFFRTEEEAKAKQKEILGNRK